MTDDALLSMSMMLAVIVRTTPFVPLVIPMLDTGLAVSTAASPGGFSRTATLLLYVALTLSPP